MNTIQPDQVHLMQPTRPPVETWVQPPDEEGLLRAQAILGEVTEIIHPAKGSFDLGEVSSLTESVLGIITRHPMREKELIETLTKWKPEEINQTLQSLKDGGGVQIIERYGVRFWSAASSHYPECKQSERTAPRGENELWFNFFPSRSVEEKD